MSQPACPRCFSLAFAGAIRAETVMPVPSSAPPLAIEDLPENASPAGSPICWDCQAAENLAKLTALAGWHPTTLDGEKGPVGRPSGLSFAARRIVVGNTRQEQLRLPQGMRPHFGLVREGLVRESAGEDPLTYHHAWLETVGIKLGMPSGVEGELFT